MISLAAQAAAKTPSAWDEPGTLGFIMVFALAVILFFLLRSMSRHLRKVREAAALEAGAGAQADAGTAVAGADSPQGQHPAR